MKAVCNSSVLISLSLIGQLDLLRQRFPDGILVPTAYGMKSSKALKDVLGLSRWQARPGLK